MADLGRRDYTKMAVIALLFAVGALAAGQFLMTEEPDMSFENVNIVSSDGGDEIISRTDSGQPDTLEIRLESMDIEYNNFSLESDSPNIKLNITAELDSPSVRPQTGQIFTNSYTVSNPDGRIPVSDSSTRLDNIDIISGIVDNPNEFFEIENGSSENYNLNIIYTASVSGVDDEEDIDARGQYQIPISVIND